LHPPDGGFVYLEIELLDVQTNAPWPDGAVTAGGVAAGRVGR
jgi:hypothetical protein